MNKKLLLLAGPAFMVLSSCGAHSVEQPEERLEAAMSESTVAQEEDARELVRTNTIYRVALTSDYVKVGYQIQFNANDEGDADDDCGAKQGVIGGFPQGNARAPRPVCRLAHRARQRPLELGSY